MIEQILYQMLGVTMIVFVLVFLWWAHVFGKETKRMLEEALRKRRVLDCHTLSAANTLKDFKPGGWIAAGDPRLTTTVRRSVVIYEEAMVPVLPEVMQELGLREYQQVDQRTAMQIINLNALTAMAQCSIAMAQCSIALAEQNKTTDTAEVTEADIRDWQAKAQAEQTYDFSDPAECERFREHVRRTSKNFFIDSNGNKIGKDPK